MKPVFAFLIISVVLGCNKDSPFDYPFVDVTWTKARILHVPDNVGAYGSFFATYRFGSNGRYTVSGPNTIEANWFWLKEGVRLKLDYEGRATYDDIVTIVTSSDTLLHVTKRIEGEPDNTGNYWEVQYSR